VAEGWSIVNLEHAAQDGEMHELYHDNDLDLFKCRASDTCLEVELNSTLANQDACGDSLRYGPLCSVCEDSYIKTPGGCEECGQWSWGELILILLLLVMVLSWKLLSRQIKDNIALNLQTAERSWPRIRQSFNILVTNWQISSKIAQNTDIDWPPQVVRFYETVGAWVDLDVLSIPGLDCVTTNNYYARWTAKICLMPAIGLLIFAWYTFLRLSATQKVKHASAEAKETRASQGKLNHNEGHLAKVEEHLDTLSRKLKASVEIGVLRSRYSGICFMFVYLLYPGTAAAAFQMLYCKRTEGGSLDSQTMLLEADLALQCREFGETNATYLLFFRLGLLAILIFPVGIPVYLWYTLYHNAETIQTNPE
jgi:hypothetical protein